MVRALSIKSKRKRIAGNVLRSQQDTSHYMQNSILSCFRAIACPRISSRQLLVKPCLRTSSRQLLVKPDLGEGSRGNFNPLPCWFSFNNSEKLNAVTLAFCSIQLHFFRDIPAKYGNLNWSRSPDIWQNSGGDISIFHISGQFPVNESCHNSRTSNYIEMKFGPVTTLDQKDRRNQRNLTMISYQRIVASLPFF